MVSNQRTVKPKNLFFRILPIETKNSAKPLSGKKESIQPKIRPTTTLPIEANKQKDPEEAETTERQNTRILEKKVLELKIYIRQLRDKFRVCS